jgi:hypothetical protein
LIFPQYSRPCFYKSIPTGGISQTGENIFKELSEIIEEVGASKICSVITDNAANMKKAWELIEDKYSHIFANGCAAHMLNLLVKDILQLPLFQSTFEKSVELVKHIQSSQELLFRFRTIRSSLKSAHQIERELELCLPVATRWYSSKKCISSVILNRDVIISLSSLSRSSFDPELASMLQGEDFWALLAQCDSILDPIVNLISVFEADSTDCSKVYAEMLNLTERPFPESIKELIQERFNFICTESMQFGYLLDPANKSGADTMQKFTDASGNEISDYEVTIDLAEAWANKNPNIVDAEKFTVELWDYLRYAKTFNDFNRLKIHGVLKYWDIILSRKFPELYKLAQRCFCTPTSSAASERVWSIFCKIVI